MIETKNGDRGDRLQWRIEGASIVVDHQGQCVAVNASAERLLGFEPGTLIGVPISEILPGETAWTRLMQDVNGSTPGSTRTVPVVLKSGLRRLIDLRVSALAGSADEVWLLVEAQEHGPDEALTAAPDATLFLESSGQSSETLTRVRRSLLESEARFRGAFDASSIGMALISFGGRFLLVNPALCDILGFSETELLTLAIDEVTHPDDRESDRQLQAQLLANEITTYQVEKKYLCKNGAVITGRLTASLVRNSEGEPDYLVAQVQDITPFKASGAALREAEARYRTLVEQIPAAVYIDQPSELGSTSYVSPRIETMLGYTPAEWMRGQVSWAERIHPADRDRVLHAAELANQTGMPIDLEYRIRARDGRDVWVSDSASLLFTEDGLPQCWHGMMIDITERKRAEDELRAAKEAAEEASRLKSTFLSMATHELRTPLTIISGYVELLAESARSHLTPEEQDYLVVAQSGAATLAGLVDDLLDLARIEAGRMELQLREVNVREAMERVRGLVHGQAVAKGLTLRIDIDDDVPTIAADLNRLAQILLNLFANAIKFTNDGSIVATVRTRNIGVEITIADTGIGISPEALPRIFDEFRQEDSGTTRRFGGSGLGLAIVKRLVEMQEGTVAAESQVGVGSRFTVWFPAFAPNPVVQDEETTKDALFAG